MVGGVIQGTVTAQSRAGSLGRGQWPTYTMASTLSAHPVCVSQAGKPRLGVPPYTAGGAQTHQSCSPVHVHVLGCAQGPDPQGPRPTTSASPAAAWPWPWRPLPRGLEDTQALSSALTTHPQSLGRQGGLLP